MPPAVAVAVAVGAGAAAVAGAVTITTALAVGAGALAASALLNKPPAGAGASPSERKQVIRSAASPMAGIVGTSQLSGVMTFVEEIKSRDELNIVVALAGHTKPAGQPVIKKVNKVLMDDEEIPLGSSHGGKVYVKVYDGSQTSISHIQPELRNLSSWRNDMIGKGICFAHIRCRYDQKLFPNSLPNFVFELDSLGSVSLSSDAILNYLRNNFGATDDEIDFDSFNTARPICAEKVSNGDGGTESRYTCNGAFNFDESHKQVIDKMRLTCAGQLTYINGKFGLRVGAYNGPADFVLTEGDIIGDVSVKPQPDRRSLINTCKGKHVWPDAKFQEVDFPKIQSEPMLAEDGEELEKDLNLEFCHSPYQCQRLAANDISRARLPVIKVPCNMRAFECYLGRNIKLHMPTIGYNHKECVVEGWELNPAKGVTLTLREDSPQIWTDIVGRVPILPPDVHLPNPKKCDRVSNIELTELEVDSVWESRITWNHPHPASVYKYRLVLEKSVKSKWVEKFNGEVASLFFVINNPASGDYRVTITAVNRFDVSASAVAKNLTINVPEISVTNVTANVDNSVYPATALIAAEVQGANHFPDESVFYETETKQNSSQWLPCGRGTAPSTRLNGLNEGRHFVRMRAIPPYGQPSQWQQTQFDVFAVEQPTELTFTPDANLNYWGHLKWTGAGQSWDVDIKQNGKSLWHSTTNDPQIWLNWQTPGDYVVSVRSRAGQLVSSWSEISAEVDDLLPPKNLSFTKDDSGSTGGLVKWQSADARMEMCEMELLNDAGEILHTAVTGSPQAIIPVLAPGEYSALIRSRWREHKSSWASLVITVVDKVSAPSDLKFTATGETAWQGELAWNNHNLPSRLEIINTGTAETVLSLTLLSGYHHVPLLPVGKYQARVRTVGTWSQSAWVSTNIIVGQPAAPGKLIYKEMPDNIATAGRLVWEGSTSAGVSGYDVLITDANGNAVLTTRVQSTWFDVGNIASGQFTAKVRATSLLAAESSDWISIALTISSLASPINLAAVETLVENGTGFTSQITLKWQANDSRTQSYDVEFRLVSVTAWSGLYSGPSNTASRNGLAAGDYRFRVRAINGVIESGWVETSLTVRGIETAPADINNLQLSGITGELAQLSWDTIKALDVINGGSIHVRHTPFTGAAATWATAVPITERLPGTTTLVTVPLLTGTYLVKAVNPADYWSKKAAAVVSNMSSLVGYNRVVDRTEPKGWPGNKNKAVIDAGGSLTLSEGSQWLSIDTNDDVWLFSGPPIPVDTTKTYRGVFRVRQTEDPTSGGSVAYAGLATLDANYQYLSGGAGSHRYFILIRTIRARDGWQEFEGTITGEGDDHKNFRPGTKYVRPMFIVNYKNGNGRAEIDYLRFYDESGRQLIRNSDFSSGKSEWSLRHSGKTVPDNAPGEIVSNPEPPFYIMATPLDLGGVFTVRLHMECDGTVYERDTIDERTDNIDSWRMFDGAVVGGTSLQFQVSTTDDDPASNSARWSNWSQFFVGEYRARAYRLRIVLVNPTPSSAATLAGLKLVADVPDRTEKEHNIAVPSGGKTITYKTPFLAPAVIAVNAQGMTTGDRYDITSNTSTGFHIRFYNSAGAGISRTFDFAAVSYGEG